MTKARCAVFCDGKGFVVIRYEDGTLRLWSASERRMSGSFRAQEFEVVSVAMSADGRCVVSGSLDTSVRLLDVAAGAQVGNALTGHTGLARSVAMNSDERRAVSGSRDQSMGVWGLEMGAQVADTLSGHKGWAVRVSRNTDVILLGSDRMREGSLHIRYLIVTPEMGASKLLTTGSPCVRITECTITAKQCLQRTNACVA